MSFNPEEETLRSIERRDSDGDVPVELTAFLVAVTDAEPRVLTVQRGRALPSGPFSSQHRTLQLGLRAWVEQQTHHPLGYLEQLYTFADRDRLREDGASRVISISYLGLTREGLVTGEHSPRWQSWYRYLPWEDWRDGPPRMLIREVILRLQEWVRQAPNAASRRERAWRVRSTFATEDREWDEDLVLQRYELIFEAGLVAEAGQRSLKLGCDYSMVHDHRRILATGVARLRAKIKYRPVVFELMQESFTLLHLQQTMEALAGRRLHKQNFRRLIDHHGLVEETGEVHVATGGRPAKLFRFRGEVMAARALMGTRLPLAHPS